LSGSFNIKIQKRELRNLATAMVACPLLILSVRRFGGKDEGISVNSRRMALSLR
jgi:hypothetical protein